jgi:hypothetical protein
MDEQDLSARAWLGGAGVRCVTAARVGHLTRSKFPYPVSFDEIEFNQLATIRTVFEPETVATLTRYFEPVPERVQLWLQEAAADIDAWREEVLRTRRISDDEFFRLTFLDFLNREIRQTQTPATT